MFVTSRKGNIVLKILSVIAFLLLVLSIEIPRRAWNQQVERQEFSQKRMMQMSDLEVVYMQETNHFSKDLKKIYDYAIKNDSLQVSAPDIEIEILTMDSTHIRISYSDYSHIEDLDVENVVKKTLENIEDKTKFIAFMKSIGCPTPEEVMDADIDEIEILLKGNLHKDFYRSLKQRYYLARENDNEHIYDGGKDLNITLKNKNPKLKLRSNSIKLSSPSNIETIAIYSGEKDIYWDFISREKISIVKNYDPELDLQHVNIGRYLLQDIETDKTPYLCPSTLDPYLVDFNLIAKVGMNIEFFKGENTGELIDIESEKLIDNEKIKNYFLNIAKLKSERVVADFVREYEMDGDSTYSSQEQQDSLFSKFFAEYLRDVAKKAPLADAITNSISSLEKDQEKNFSEEAMFDLLFRSSMAEIVINEISKENNTKALEELSFAYTTSIIKVDTVSVKISSPINKNSQFKGYSRNFFEKQFLFGIEDDVNAGSIDNGTSSWKSE
ncbi:MAG: hypothetical protein PF574_03480 [Candidatus Delongbacteria bacterium]|jgi:hypothetical protein|nr:hypothetical protein [Candidatus Delongbacteria bacterium]